MCSPPQLTPTRQPSAHPEALEPSLPSCPPPLLAHKSHKPVTPLRHRTGVTFSFCAFPAHFSFYRVSRAKQMSASFFSYHFSVFRCLNHDPCQPLFSLFSRLPLPFTSSCILTSVVVLAVGPEVKQFQAFCFELQRGASSPSLLSPEERHAGAGPASVVSDPLCPRCICLHSLATLPASPPQANILN